MTADISDEELKRRWRKNWLYSLLELSDLDVQQRWIDKKIQNPQWTYVEFMCFYFDDVIAPWRGYSYLLKQGFLSDVEYSCIKEFHDALDDYKPPNDDRHNPQAILQDQKWSKIVEIGRLSMSALEKIISDQSEKEIFSKKLYARELTSGDYNWPKT